MRQQAPLNSVQANAANSRVSLGGQKLATGGGPAKRQSIAGRQSLAAPARPSTSRRSTLGSSLQNHNGNDKKSSIGGKRRASMPESRPIKEPQFISDSSRKVVAFLNEKGYEEQITVKSLNAPSIKVFASIVQFCFRQIDPHFSFKGQFDEEIPALFRLLEYPIAIQKQELKVISAHQWPRLLAALTWLVDLLQYEEKRAALQSDVAATTAGAEDTEMLFFEFLTASYRLFMDEIDDTTELDKKFKGQFDDRNRQIEDECSQLERQNATLQKDISRLEEQTARLPELRRNKQAQQDDLGKFGRLCGELEEYLAKVLRKRTALEKDLAAKRKRLESLTKEKDTLAARLAVQEASGVDYGALAREQRALEEQLAQLRQSRELATRMRGEHEIAMHKLLEVVEAELRLYSELCHRLQLLPAASNTRVPDVAFELQCKSHARADDMVVGDLPGSIKPALKALRTQLNSAQRAAAAESLALRERLDQLQEQCEIRRDDAATLKARVEQREQQLRATKDALDEDQKQLRLAAKAVRDETEALVRQGLHALQQSHLAVDRLRAEENRLKARCAAQSQDLNTAIIDVIDRLTGHKQYIQQRLRELSDAADAAAREMVGMETQWTKASLNKSQM